MKGINDRIGIRDTTKNNNMDHQKWKIEIGNKFWKDMNIFNWRLRNKYETITDSMMKVRAIMMVNDYCIHTKEERSRSEKFRMDYILIEIENRLTVINARLKKFLEVDSDR